MCIDPLISEDYPNGIVNIVTGRISPDSVIVDESLSLGNEQMQHFEAGWPDSFYEPLPSKGVTMSISTQQIKTWVKRLL